MGEKIRAGIKYWSQLLLLPIYWFSFLIPKNKKMWVYGSTFGRRFADNPRYFYLYMNQNVKDVRSVWISKEAKIVEFLNGEGYEAYLAKSLKGILICLRAKVYLYDNYSKDINHWISGGSIKINMWHGISLKKIQMDNIFDEVRHPKTFWKRIQAIPRRLTDEKSNHYILSVSEFFAPICASAFATRNVLKGGYPRSDIFLGNQIKNIYMLNEKKCMKEIEKNQDKKIFLYMPTFRESEELFLKVIDLEEFCEFLRENKMLFCIKLHCKSKLQKKIAELQNDAIYVIEPDTDPNLYLALSDVLVTDYSSVYFDYLLLDKPIIFFHYDLKEYLSQSREMYFDYHEFTPGVKADSMETLIKSMLRLEAWMQEGSNALYRKKIFQRIYDNPKELASKRLQRDIYQMIKLEFK